MQNQNPSQPVKKNTGLIVAIVIIVILVLGIGGYFITKYLAKVANEKIMSGLSGADVKIGDDGSYKIKDGEDSFEASGSASWPEDMPKDVLKYDSGKILMSAKISNPNKGWSVTIEDTNKDYFNQYKSKLKSSGWSETSELDSAIDIIQMEKDNLFLICVFDKDSNGINITVSEK